VANNRQAHAADTPRSDLDTLLAAWIEAGPRPNLPVEKTAKGAVIRLPVIRKGVTIGYRTEPVGDYRPMTESHHLALIRELQRALALSEGEDSYRIARLALSVGAGAQLPDSLVGKRVREGGGKGVQNRSAEERDERARRDNAIRKAVSARRTAHQGESFRHVCGLIAPNHRLSAKQVGRVCADLKW
jgi:hypothetical protein